MLEWLPSSGPVSKHVTYSEKGLLKQYRKTDFGVPTLVTTSLRACLHGKRVPLGYRGTRPSRVEDSAVLHAMFLPGRGTLPPRDKNKQ